jgi:hypothetical protein
MKCCYNNLRNSTLYLFFLYNCSHSAFETVLQAMNVAKLNPSKLLYVSCIDTVANVTVYILDIMLGYITFLVMKLFSKWEVWNHNVFVFRGSVRHACRSRICFVCRNGSADWFLTPDYLLCQFISSGHHTTSSKLHLLPLQHFQIFNVLCLNMGRQFQFICLILFKQGL